MGKGQKLYSKAKQIVAGGNMLLSKRPEMFLPEQWPSYFSKSKGCEVWDLDGNKYIDTLMMPGTNSLGYNYEEIDWKLSTNHANHDNHKLLRHRVQKQLWLFLLQQH